MYTHKYLKYKQKYTQLKLELKPKQKPKQTGGARKYLYHGSSSKLTILEPRPSRVIDGEEAVFATNTKWLAIFFIGHTSDADFELGFINDVPYILEQYEGAIDKLRTSGYIYQLDAKYFSSDDRLGMKHHEFISKEAVPVLRTKKVANVLDALKSEPVAIITWDEKAKWLERTARKKLDMKNTNTT